MSESVLMQTEIMLKSLKAHSSIFFMAIPQVVDSVSNCLIMGQSVPIELVVGMFITAVLAAEPGMEESPVGERAPFIAYPSIFIHVIYQ